MFPRLLSGRYSVVQQLGAGGFSQTFLAKDTQLPGQPLCVVKQLKPQIKTADRWHVAKRLFDTEAAVLYQLGNHDQIPRLLAHFEDNQEFFLVQEFVEGEPLDKLLQIDSTWTEGQVLRRLHDLLQVLVFVHEQQVIHRDIKPSNLIRRRHDDKLVLIDFGAVKQVSSPLQDAAEQSLTISIGTQGYMPPEQISGNPRFNSDLYAVGMVAIQALTGVRPNQLQRDSHTGELVWRTSQMAARPDTAVPENRLPSPAVSPAFAEILDRMVRYDFRERYQTVEEPLEAIEALLAQRTFTEAEEVADLTGATTPWQPNLMHADFGSSGFSSEETSAEPATEPSATPSAVPIVAIPSAPTPSVFATAYSDASALQPPAESAKQQTEPPHPSLEPPHPSLEPPHSAKQPPLPTPPFGQTSPTRIAAPKRAADSTSTSFLWTDVRFTPWLLLLGGVIAAAVGFSTQSANSRLQSVAPSTSAPSASVLASALPALPCREPPPSPLPSTEASYEYPDGTRYYGLIEGGRPANGRATVVFSTGNRYDGEFQNGRRNGCGTYSFANGRRYIGQFKADQFDGLGIWLLGDGNRYVGQFKDNRCHGEGIFLFKDGGSERGTWQNGKQVNGELTCDR